MAALGSELRGLLERTVVQARDAAEQAALDGLETLAVASPETFRRLRDAWAGRTPASAAPTSDRDEAPAGLAPEARKLRVALRARGRQLGGGSLERGLPLLVQEVAYEGWHRMLFARFLAENQLLMHPSGVPVTLEECAELAPEEGEPDGWMTAARYAAAMLPGIFRHDDPSAQVRFAPEGRQRLERLLDTLPPAVFTADDALGWVYQFWQSRQKKEVNESGRKIGGADIAPVTQLFTEHYMVAFLLENSLGAWWAARHPESPLVKKFSYLRFKDDGTPAAGAFPGWPDRAAEVTVMDPCCGSGHFLVAAFEMLRRMRMEEEGLGEAAAADAVLRDNLFGLEIDSRCTQIAAFALALAVWKAGGYRKLPLPNIACSGIPVQGQWETWKRLAGGNSFVECSLERLYQLFRHAPDLGSLINPADIPARDRMFSADYAEVEPLLVKALEREQTADDPTAALFGQAAAGVARAAGLLARTYTLIATNVPYLARGKQGPNLAAYCDAHYPESKGDLATTFVERCRTLTQHGGSYAVVTPQNWLFLGTYRRLRERLLNEQSLLHVSWLGPGAFETISGEVVKAVLVAISNDRAVPGNCITGVDASEQVGAAAKAAHLATAPLQTASQAAQLQNPDARIALTEAGTGRLLEAYASSYQGMKTGDDARLVRCFWEIGSCTIRWRRFQSTVQATVMHGGLELMLDWSRQGRDMARLQGLRGWGRAGVAISQMSSLPASLYGGEAFDSNMAAIIPHNPAHLPAIWAFCSSPEYAKAVRRIDQSLKVTNASLVKVPFDLARWQAIADAAGPLPEPYSNDPTQWLFKSHPVDSTEPLQTAVARLLGYRWPQQEADGLDALSDDDGVACIPAVAGEEPAAERLRALLAAAFGKEWSTARLESFLSAADFGGKGLEAWLRDGFFAQHCRLFHNRPFIWQVWDGRRDGFSALVNYHKLDRALLDKLIYTYLGSWIDGQRHAREANEPGAEDRLVKALALQQRLIAIRDGEPPYDIYVRWKPPERQPIGWEPDLNDGVRLNIRPFVEAGVLRSRFTINWNKDRGTNPDGSERINDRHLTIAEKRAARQGGR